MTENHSNSDSDSRNSSKRLVKILVIVGIGIPVLVELMTLFNLINVQIFDDEEVQEQPEPVAEVRQVTEGDTLFRDYRFPVTIELLRINVSAQEWRFELGLSVPDSVDREPLEIELDSMQLNSGKILAAGRNRSWNIQEGHTPPRIQAEWELPNGDIPGTLYISSFQQMQNDTASRVQQEVPLGNIPVRYNRE
ncbi:hypothetical protein SAMN05443144_12121 [Fodinibius roseus]|uniref:Uncharacterized protein n=1 Tax=Fodinibius roseus TaxID=1194090 RepID=A0A1M5HUI0_9BACT|nr:hypothetical protein [Fodinibius roseus]SHG19522.1 hypothetical protein SAMN05443144_12121 [Fodinibius roseus]